MSSIDIYSILSSKPHNPHYLNRYWKFIQSYVGNKMIKGITENHHICPKAKDLFPEYKSLKFNPWNGIHLTRKQHWIAHWMLAKAYGNSQNIAFYRMTKKSSHRVTSSVYEKFREDICGIISKSNSKPNINVSIAKSGKVACYDALGNYLILTKEEFHMRSDVYGIAKYMNREYMRSRSYIDSLLGKHKGRLWVTEPISKTKKFIKSHELETYLNMGFIQSYDAYDRKLYQKTCPHCNKTMDPSNFSRWHGNNCKLSRTQ